MILFRAITARPAELLAEPLAEIPAKTVIGNDAVTQSQTHSAARRFF